MGKVRDIQQQQDVHLSHGVRSHLQHRHQGEASVDRYIQSFTAFWSVKSLVWLVH